MTEYVPDIDKKINMLRQWLNERPSGSPLITNNDIRYWLGLPKEDRMSIQEALEKAHKQVGRAAERLGDNPSPSP